MPKQNDRSLQQYNAMTSEELAQILRLDSEAPEGNGLDIDTLLYISGVLAEREKDSKTGKTAQQAWAAFQQHYMPSGEDPCPDTAEAMPIKPRKPWLRRAVAAAAAVALLVFVPLSAKALNWEKIRTAVAAWTTGSFFFIGEEQPPDDTPVTGTSHAPGTFQYTLAEAGINPDIIPAWLPDGFVLEDIDSTISPSKQLYTAFYMHKEDATGKKNLRMTVCTYKKGSPLHHQFDGKILEVYSSAGIDFYIFSNNGWFCAAWMTGPYECSIGGLITLEQLKQMIDSIPKG